jgi:hypothetical protein
MDPDWDFWFENIPSGKPGGPELSPFQATAFNRYSKNLRDLGDLSFTNLHKL